MPMNYQFVESLFQNRIRLSIEKACKIINKPHLIIHGTEDEAVDLNEATALNIWSKKSEIEIIQGANHVFGGKHPWQEKFLPEHSIKAIDKTINFLID